MDLSGVNLSGVDISLLNQVAAQFANASCAVNSAINCAVNNATNCTTNSLTDCAFAGQAEFQQDLSCSSRDRNEFVDVVNDFDG